ncbi:biopolymer transporter ExbD [Paraburkholderia sp.]|uniref:ExbD/TolR family protein n=1 Tax=Paraburkholderia sp. TaxID=1926495 RepID=UPI0025E1844E|nr:biopolymer transporter ExbD [Paraburkholderia sp.]
MIHFEEPQQRHARIEIIPMIDVMMFLLVFFVLLSINVISARGVQTNLPQSSTSTSIDPGKPLVVTVTREGPLQVNGADTTLAALAEAVRGEARDNPVPTVTLRTDEAATMQRVIDVMDVLKRASITKVAIATRSKPE